jgi:hypothetical protein
MNLYTTITAAMEGAGVDLHVNTEDLLMEVARGKSERAQAHGAHGAHDAWSARNTRATRAREARSQLIGKASDNSSCSFQFLFVHEKLPIV